MLIQRTERALSVIRIRIPRTNVDGVAGSASKTDNGDEASVKVEPFPIFLPDFYVAFESLGNHCQYHEITMYLERRTDIPHVCLSESRKIAADTL